MIRPPAPRTIVPALTALVALACAGPPEPPSREDISSSDPAGDSAAPSRVARAPDPGSPADRMSLPGLFTIMAGLESEMARLDRGLWEESYDTIAAGAGRVADHPPIPTPEAQRIASVLGAEMGRFQELDRTVHDLAVRAEEAARRGELDAVLGAVTGLRNGCTTCHEEFRTRLREALR